MEDKKRCERGEIIGGCSPEKIAECHGEEKPVCPDDPKECSAEQIEKCHGKNAEHKCGC